VPTTRLACVFVPDIGDEEFDEGPRRAHASIALARFLFRALDSHEGIRYARYG
jgi:hypothetical protein